MSILAYLVYTQIVRSALTVNAICTQRGCRCSCGLALRIHALGGTIRAAVRRTVGIILLSLTLTYAVATVTAAANRILPRVDLLAVQVT